MTIMIYVSLTPAEGLSVNKEAKGEGRGNLVQLGFWGEVFSVTMPSYPDKKSGLIGLAVYDKRRNSVSLISHDDEKLPCFYPNFTDGNSSLISFIDPAEAITFYNENLNKYQFEKSFDELIQKIKIDDNPVLMIVKLKE